MAIAPESLGIGIRRHSFEEFEAEIILRTCAGFINRTCTAPKPCSERADAAHVAE